METYGLIGFPLGHSFSKDFFNNKFVRENRKAVFKNYEIEDIADIKKIIQQTNNLKGLCVTIPHKENIIKYLDTISEDAKEIGAVNSVKVEIQNNKTILTGYNTDAYGFGKSLSKFIPDQCSKALILGTGGASKAVAYALTKLNIEYTKVSRTPNKDILGYQKLEKCISDYDLIINTTPLGTFPNSDECPDIPYSKLKQEQYLFDLVYNPEKTLFLTKGEKMGCKIKNGLEMLHLQAEYSWKLWHNEG